MSPRSRGKSFRLSWLLVAGLIVCGCQSVLKRLSDRLSHWPMLGQDAAADPIQAVGGDGVIFLPVFEDKPLSRKQLAAASREVLLAYYAPIYVQQRACPP